MHAWWVEPDRLLAGEYPGSLSEDKAKEKVRLLMAAGINSFVDLTESDELRPYAPKLLVDAAEQAGRPVPSHHRFAIRDMSILADEAGYDVIVAHIRSELDAGKGVYIHCWGGKGRTGTVVGCWLIDNYGLDYKGAIQRMRDLRAGTRKSVYAPIIPETEQQHGVLRRRAARTSA
ncbi:serine/threonine protein phosphatase [Mycobacterium sp.]|uniref:protein-tyrosine phosphatase family protein n=1 Tax=Mycobacterium sp. TaxID=1785 RepID=UPI002C71548E|nr:serine/threonine protein phosphatase [Mycobacterium sp.]HTQ16783.1 serine/threonine protein phosphatase [Mycobacterium sp.]